jgi:hypothetical protein
MTGRTYAENRPYLLPEAFEELVGPVIGVIQLPLRLDWSERTEFHPDDPAKPRAYRARRGWGYDFALAVGASERQSMV